MSSVAISPPFPIYSDADGQPLDNGYIWIGTANIDPQINPISVYWDAALTIPAAQPIRTSGGYPLNNGTPARPYVAGEYSIRVTDKNGTAVYTAARIQDTQPVLVASSSGGTSDAITATLSGNVSLTNGTTVIVRAVSANTTTTPTFSPNGLTAKIIVKANNIALVAGDVAGAGHWIEMQYDSVLDRWVLQNPAMWSAHAPAAIESVMRITGAVTLDPPSTLQKFTQPIQCVSGGTYAVTLPLAASCGSGSIIHFMNTQTSGTVTIQRQGSDNIYTSAVATVTSLALNGVNQVYLISTGANWVLYGGTMELQYSASFSHSKAMNGYQMLPSGVMFQWGEGDTSGGHVELAFPTAFPTYGASFQATISNACTTGGWGQLETNNLGLTGIDIWCAAFGTPSSGGSNGNFNFHWHAIGY